MWLVTMSGAALPAQEIRWLPDHSAVEVTGVDEALLKSATASRDKCAALFSVQTDGTDAKQPSMLGTWSAAGTALRFTPRFPLTAGVRYRATWQPPGGKAVTSLHEVQKKNAAPSTMVEHIYPGSDVLPENLLKFYLHFSAPMSGGGIYQHIHLRDETGREVELPFLEIDEELWDREMKRLTLFIDPGRIKRGVKPLEEIGPALVAGKRFTLTIDAAWQDAAGLPLKQAGVKTFTVSPPDRTPPDPKAWKITAPPSQSCEPLRVAFSEPMEQALALRLIAVADVPGQAALDESGIRWSFTPDKPWRAGAHRLVIQPDLEDLAGNSIGKPFEVDIAGTVKEKPAEKAMEIGFNVK
jgi:hypothetical protein